MLEMVIHMKKRVKEKPLRWIAIWIALGAAIGVPMENIPLGVGMGVCKGFLLFLIHGFRNNKKLS